MFLATKNIRTVTSLQCGRVLHADFCQRIENPVKNQYKKGVSVGLAMSVADAILFFAYAACFWLGSWLIQNEYIAGSEYDKIYKSMMGVVFGAIVLGQNSSFMSNYAEAIQAGKRILALLKVQPLIDVFNEGNN